MNIFAIDDNTKTCALALDDKRLVKMVLETAQMLSGAMNIHGTAGPYRPTHLGHPCTVWVSATQGNYQWTLNLFQELLSEYTFRYGRQHKCRELYEVFDFFSRHGLNDGLGRTTFANCTIYKDKEVISAYKDYLRYKWDNDKRQPKWTNRQPPTWYRSEDERIIGQ